MASRAALLDHIEITKVITQESISDHIQITCRKSDHVTGLGVVHLAHWYEVER